MRLWIREEARDTERRAPLAPQGAAMLVAQGADVMVERSARRVFADADYAAAGCRLVDSGSWTEAPEDALVLGVKELPPAPATLHGRFAHFAHLYKDQRGWRAEIERFRGGGATLYDLEYLTDESGARVAAFGYWAGWLGAALAVRGWLAREAGETMPGPVASAETRDAFLTPLRAGLAGGALPRVLIVGALGRSGRGARDLCAACGIVPTCWDKEDTRALDRAALLDHDMLVSCVLMTGPGLTLLRHDDIGTSEARLSIVSDVACDPLSDFNPLPVYDAPTGWDRPFVAVGEGESPLWLTAIDNLPSLLPREASEDFSMQLAPVLAGYPDAAPWRNAEAAYRNALARA